MSTTDPERVKEGKGFDNSTTNSEDATSDLLTLVCTLFNSCASGVVSVLCSYLVSVKHFLRIVLYSLSTDPAMGRATIGAQ